MPPHTLSIVFRHLSPNSARTGYASKGALLISTQLSTDAVNAFRKVEVIIILPGSNIAAKHAPKREARPPRVKKKGGDLPGFKLFSF